MSGLYAEGWSCLTWQNELEVVFSLMMDKELMTMKDSLESMIKDEVYSQKEFPLSCGGLRFLIATIMFSFWVRKGKGIRLENGEIVVCELKESPWWHRYQLSEQVFVKDGDPEFEPESPEHERDEREECGHEPEDTQFCNHKHSDEERGEFV